MYIFTEESIDDKTAIPKHLYAFQDDCKSQGPLFELIL